MAVKTYSPVTPSRRFITGDTFEEVTRRQSEKSLTKGLKKKGGRNSLGRMTVRRRGGGHKRRYRAIEFKRDKFGILLRSPQSSMIPVDLPELPCSITPMERNAISSHLSDYKLMMY